MNFMNSIVKTRITDQQLSAKNFYFRQKFHIGILFNKTKKSGDLQESVWVSILCNVMFVVNVGADVWPSECKRKVRDFERCPIYSIHVLAVTCRKQLTVC